MKTTIDLSNALLEEARRAAAERGTTVKALVEAGLRREVREGGPRARRFRLRDESFTGRGLQPGVADATWERIRELAYAERGG
jgi:Arc/MetJ family transcription regulator